MDSLEEDDSQITKDGEVVDQSAAAEDIDLLLGHDQVVAA
jgi:FKBP-type peptidyl-prolyl cis-trans isomerase 2